MTITAQDLKTATDVAKAVYLATDIADEAALRTAGTTFRTLERAYFKAIKVKRTPQLRSA